MKFHILFSILLIYNKSSYLTKESLDIPSKIMGISLKTHIDNCPVVELFEKGKPYLPNLLRRELTGNSHDDTFKEYEKVNEEKSKYFLPYAYDFTPLNLPQNLDHTASILKIIPLDSSHAVLYFSCRTRLTLLDTSLEPHKTYDYTYSFGILDIKPLKKQKNHVAIMFDELQGVIEVYSNDQLLELFQNETAAITSEDEEEDARIVEQFSKIPSRPIGFLELQHGPFAGDFLIWWDDLKLFIRQHKNLRSQNCSLPFHRQEKFTGKRYPKAQFIEGKNGKLLLLGVEDNKILQLLPKIKTVKGDLKLLEYELCPLFIQDCSQNSPPNFTHLKTYQNGSVSRIQAFQCGKISIIYHDGTKISLGFTDAPLITFNKIANGTLILSYQDGSVVFFDSNLKMELTHFNINDGNPYETDFITSISQKKDGSTLLGTNNGYAYSDDKCLPLKKAFSLHQLIFLSRFMQLYHQYNCDIPQKKILVHESWRFVIEEIKLKLPSLQAEKIEHAVEFFSQKSPESFLQKRKLDEQSSFPPSKHTL